MTEFIRAENLIFDYEKADGQQRRALDGVDFSIEKGSFTAIIGHNGSGKSTLAKNINALLRPTSGRVFVDGIDTAAPENVWKVRSRVAMVFQNPDNQIVSAIVEDDIAFGPENLGVEPEKIRERVAFALDAVEMEEYRGKPPHLLSGGQKQRIAIAGAVAMEPECIVFDEPTAMLDPRGRREVLEVIEKLHSAGMTVILITHFMEEAARADRIIVMKDGRIHMDDTPVEIFRKPDKLEELSMTVPPAVRLASLLRKRGIDIPENVMEAEELASALKKTGATADGSRAETNADTSGAETEGGGPR